MLKRPWILSPRVLLWIAGGVVVYGCVAAGWGFHIMPFWSDGNPLLERVREGVLLWFVACVVVGWALYLRGYRPERAAVVWPLLVPPAIAAAWSVATVAVVVYGAYLGRSPLAPGTFWFNIMLPLIAYGGMILMYGAIAAQLFLGATVWRKSVTPGRCPTCDYDLTGNASGVCPECGAWLVLDPEIPRQFYARRFRFLPELAQFPDARGRYEAVRRLGRATNWPALVSAAFVFALVALNFWGGRVVEELSLAFQIVLYVVCAVGVLWMRAACRRDLRRQLAELDQEQKRAVESGKQVE